MICLQPIAINCLQLTVFAKFRTILGCEIDCLFLVQIITEFTEFPGSSPNRFMVDIEAAQIPTAFDPFAEVDDDSGSGGVEDYVHVRVQQRNGRKSLTTVSGLNQKFKFEKILKDVKKEFCCNGNVVVDKELGKILQLQGDQRKNLSTFLVSGGIVAKDRLKIHGF